MGEEIRITEAPCPVEEEEARAQVDIWKYVFGFTEIAAVKCAIELGIAEALENHGGSPMTLDELSSNLHCSRDALFRIMRFLTHRGIFKETTSTNSNGYVQTPLSRMLMRRGEKSMAAFVLLESSPVMLAPWQSLSALVSGTASSSFEVAHGKDVWRYAETNQTHSSLINDAMSCSARKSMGAVIDGCPDLFKGVSSLVDVGGGDGTALRVLTKSCPWIQGINFDLPHVASVAPPSPGVQHVGGNMFDSVPKADAAFLMWVLHDWGDEECIHILKNCREAIPVDKGKVIVVEAVIDGAENELSDVGLMLDMVMMAHTTKGKERTSTEWSHVLTAAGFSRYSIRNIKAVQSVIVAYP